MILKRLRQKLAETPPSNERHGLQVDDADSGAAVNLTIVKRDALSSLAWEVCVRRTAPAHRDMRTWGENIAERVTSLLAPLRLIEVDTQRNQALLRSVVGARHQDDPTYFEVILDGTTTATVRRFQASTYPQAEGAAVPRREQVAFALTHEGLLKLVSDLLGA